MNNFCDAVIELIPDSGKMRWEAKLGDHPDLLTDDLLYQDFKSARAAAIDYLKRIALRDILLDFMADALDDRGLISPKEYRSLVQSIRLCLFQ